MEQGVVMKQTLVGRWLLTYDGAVKGFLRIEEDTVSEVCLGEPPSRSSRAIILPSFVNAHTHIGDAVAFPAPKGSIDELVGPDGYKHRSLRSTPRESRVAAMNGAARFMASTGTSLFVDFREGGFEGLRELSEALGQNCLKAVVLGRPLGPEITESEVRSMLDACDGIGLSAYRDWPADFVKIISRAAKSRRKMFALHASEAIREDIDPILDLKPSFIVHMTSARETDLTACASERVPIVVCPRSNEFFGLCPDIPTMLRLGITLGLGTDNCMVSKPDVIEELKAAFRMSKRKGEISPLEAVRMATFCGRKVLSATGNIATEIGTKDDLTVMSVGGEDPLLDLVTAGNSQNIQLIIRGGKVRWRSETWTR
jgi:cytosine/adenosine deaminase-related metal-dependent hydrolase